MHGGLAPLVLGCGGILVGLLGDGWMDGHSVSASRLMGGPLYARPVSAASHHFPSSQLLSRSAQSQVNVQSDHDSNAPPCYVYTQADRQAGRQAGKEEGRQANRPDPTTAGPSMCITQHTHDVATVARFILSAYGRRSHTAFRLADLE